MLLRVIESAFYKSALRKAPRLAKNAHSLLNLLKSALVKVQSLGVGTTFDLLREKVVVLGSLLKAYATGEYRNIEFQNVLKVVAGFIYFISPIDLIPDFLPYVGLTDDVALLMFIIKSISNEIEKFEQWKKAVPQPN
ncbi:YkvA family protein [Emticicia soli]|uniref:YkvA family protein n=1 Tax=Emticicia soli TaxID=2027878 RepID=A0ABW5J841_9BACT